MTPRFVDEVLKAECSVKRPKADLETTGDITCRYCKTVLDINSADDRSHIVSYCGSINLIVLPVLNTDDLTPHVLAARLAGATKISKLEIIAGAVT